MRQSVGVLVWNKDRTKLLTVTNRRWGGFSCPGGKIEPGESLEVAARRELEEETALKATHLKPVGAYAHDSVPKDGDRSQWFCTYFEADVGDQQPTQMEKGTVIGWHTPQEIRTKSMYPDFYNKLFEQLEL